MAQEKAIGSAAWKAQPFRSSEEGEREIIQEFFDECDEVERAAKKRGGKALSRPPRDYTHHFPLNLKGWKYQRLVERGLAKRREEDPHSLWFFDKTMDPITVTFYRKLKKSSVAATWRTGSLTLWGIPTTLYRVKLFDPYVRELVVILRHELQHMAQDLLREGTQVERAGLPTKSQKPIPEGIGFIKEHALLDSEFFTRLEDDIEGFNQNIKPHVKDLQQAIKIFIDSAPARGNLHPSPFFEALHKHDRKKWKKAIGDFYKAVSD